jgi:hypothetical protein
MSSRPKLAADVAHPADAPLPPGTPVVTRTRSA